jgi:hypothetical protein
LCVFFFNDTATTEIYSLHCSLSLHDALPIARYVLHSMFCPHSVFMCFVWIWEQTVIISLYSFNWLVFITETECVYSAVRTGFLNWGWGFRQLVVGLQTQRSRLDPSPILGDLWWTKWHWTENKFKKIHTHFGSYIFNSHTNRSHSTAGYKLPNDSRALSSSQLTHLPCRDTNF